MKGIYLEFFDGIVTVINVIKVHLRYSVFDVYFQKHLDYCASSVGHHFESTAQPTKLLFFLKIFISTSLYIYNILYI